MAVTVISSMTLGGVVQAPGRPDEDSQDGFAYGGWGSALRRRRRDRRVG